MTKTNAYVVSFDENVSYLSTSMNLYEQNEHFFMNETTINLTGQTSHHDIIISFYNSVTEHRNLKMAGLANRNIVLNTCISCCVSLALVFDLFSFYFSTLAD